MGRVKRYVEVGAAVAIGLSLTACGGSSGKKAAAAPAGASSSASPTPDDTTATDPAPPAAPGPSPSLSDNALLAGLLPAGDFGSGMKYDDGSPFTAPDGPGDVSSATGSDCELLIQGGSRQAGIEVADASGSPAHSGSGIQGFFERAEQYNSGDSAMALNAMIEQAQSTCLTYKSQLDDGTKTTETFKATSVSGVGMIAEMFEDKMAFPGGTLYFDTLTAEYGDVLITVGCDGPSLSQVHGCKLDAKAKKIAAALKIS